MEVLRSWMEDPDSTDLRGRVSAALDTVNALLGLHRTYERSSPWVSTTPPIGTPRTIAPPSAPWRWR